MSTENKNTNTTNEVANTQAQQEQQAVENQQPVQQQEPEKKFDWKGLGKKVLIGVGATAAAVGTFAAGYFTGTKVSENSQGQQATGTGTTDANQQ